MFCEKCGEKLQPIHINNTAFTGSFDKETGKPEMKDSCVNPACKQGCFNICGHVIKWGGFFSINCVRCGFPVSVGW